MKPSRRRSSTPAPTSCRRPRSSSRRTSIPNSTGLGFKAGWTWRDLTQHYDFFQTELTPPANTITLASIPNGVINKNVSLYDGEGQTILLLNRYAIDQYVAAQHRRYYTVQTAADAKADNVNDYRLSEKINAEYAEAQYKMGDLYALLGVRYEFTSQTIVNELPSPLNQSVTFAPVTSTSSLRQISSFAEPGL